MLLDEDPATLIHHTIGNFNIFPDKHAVARINDTLQTLRTSRDYQVREAETALKKLSRSQATLSSHHAETLSSHSSTAHASTIARLDTQKFRIAKNASDLEIETERLSSQLADLQAKLAELEIQGVDGYDSNSMGASVGPAASRGASVEDEVLLRLAVYRSLGMTVERDEATGEYGKVVVSNGKKGDVHVVNLDGKFSKFFYSNYFWGVL